jgi:hypothetical protein
MIPGYGIHGSKNDEGTPIHQAIRRVTAAIGAAGHRVASAPSLLLDDSCAEEAFGLCAGV